MCDTQASVDSGGGSSSSIPDRLFHIFIATLSPDKATRQSAEDALAQLADKDPHFVLHLLELACHSPTVCAHTFGRGLPATASALLASAIRFRNEIGRSDWNRNPRCSDEVRQRVRDHVVSLQCQPHVSEAVRRQLLTATIEVVNADYPERWPDLLPQLTGLVSQSMTALRGLFDCNASSCQEIDGDVIHMMLLQLKGSLGVLRGCCKIYVDPLKVDADEVDVFAGHLSPLLLSLMELLSGRWQHELTALAGHGAATATSGPSLAALFCFSAELEELAHCMRLSLKCIFSLFESRWPACLCEVSALDYLYASCVVTPIQVFQQAALPLCRARLAHALHHPAETGMTVTQLRGDHFSNFQQSAMFTLLKWVMNIAHKLTQEFASPKSCERRCRTVAKHFTAQYLQPTVEAALALVRWHAGPPLALTSKAYILALEVLTLAVQHKAVYASVLHPSAEELMTVLLFPRLAFTDEDEELWSDNPEEYVRKQANPAGDIYSAKVVSTNLLMSLAAGTKKFHDKSLFLSLMNFLLNQLQAYVGAAAQATSDDAHLSTPAMEAARRVDASLYCFYHFKKILLAMRFGDDKLEYVLSTFTVPVTQYSLGFLRARAVLVLSTFAPSLEWSSPLAYQQALQPVLCLLNDSEAPVRVQACVCFSRLVCHPFARDVINPCIAELIQHYFNVMRMIDNEAVVRTLRKTISFYKNTLSQWALELTEMLVSHFAVVLERVTAKYNALESMTSSTAQTTGGGDKAELFLDNDGFADVLMTADELLETLTTLVKALPESTATVAARHAAADLLAKASGASSSSPSAAAPCPSTEALQQDIFVQIQLRVAPMLFVILGHQGGSSYGFMDPALSLLTTLIARSPAIAPPMWKVLWCLYQLIIRGGAVDYIQQLLPPIDNFVSVEPASFLYGTLAELTREPLPAAVPAEEAAQTPAQLVLAMCEAVLASTSLREREVAAVPKLLDVIVQCSWAASAAAASTFAFAEAAHALVQYVTQLSLKIAGTRPQQSATFRVLLANNIFSCLIADAPAAVAVLHGLQVTRPFLEQYVSLLARSVSIEGSEEAMLGLMRGYDRSLFVYAMVSCLRALAANTIDAGAAELRSGLEGAVQCGVLQQLAEMETTNGTAELRVHQRRIAKLSGKPVPTAHASEGASAEEAEDDEEEWDSEASSEEDDDGEWLQDDDDGGEWGEVDADSDSAEGFLGGEGAGHGPSRDSRFQGMLRQAQALRETPQQSHRKEAVDDADDADDADLDDFEEENLLDDEDFSSPVDGINAWAALVSEVERTDVAAGGSASVVALLRSAAGQAQASAIVRARDLTCELQVARQTHRALLDQVRH
ncbi:conserved hypothetical protein [Leishmania infantum JPCM5]|uniref:Uncharacterized protein n=2 Tax=Leishmania infantum TaxID=5671 RepID=A4HVJ2_LEIIN|nr:conserved hypothetical protein [Leishmania infantum JPCM5]CAC9465522.1 hypothetical_protein_-_conserved [Leishmania infantum]CAM66459.1 conserved hypothetical protein [Leishmania infantum JPCM5]SUZ40113.1 hypothetical_protein_-_conserved [Leishmania infantum]|eukprot:XP_001464083.1 conserved hypothetical protein [Leishmania infantum JPCM5]